LITAGRHGYFKINGEIIALLISALVFQRGSSELVEINILFYLYIFETVLTMKNQQDELSGMFTFFQNIVI